MPDSTQNEWDGSGDMEPSRDHIESDDNLSEMAEYLRNLRLPTITSFGPSLHESVEFTSIPTHDIPRLVVEYVKAMETERTNKWCKCEWITHPDDTEKPVGERRLRRGEAGADCPIHTKEGFILGFFSWVFAEPQGIITNPEPGSIDTSKFIENFKESQRLENLKEGEWVTSKDPDED